MFFVNKYNKTTVGYKTSVLLQGLPFAVYFSEINYGLLRLVFTSDGVVVGVVRALMT